MVCGIYIAFLENQKFGKNNQILGITYTTFEDVDSTLLKYNADEELKDEAESELCKLSAARRRC